MNEYYFLFFAVFFLTLAGLLLAATLAGFAVLPALVDFFAPASFFFPKMASYP